jgi:molybdopterin-guanine dinucleotide biosynthesis adapter protein
MPVSRPILLAISGYKKSGKTTLIESLVSVLTKRGLRVGVIKHQNEAVEPERPGSDTQRFGSAGAAVVGYDGQSIFWKAVSGNLQVESAGALSRDSTDHPEEADRILSDLIRRLEAYADLILIEGFKKCSVDKIWLLKEGEEKPPAEITLVIQVLRWGEDRLTAALGIIEKYLKAKPHED